MRYTLRDTSLPHQVILSASHGKITVSCNCRLERVSADQNPAPGVFIPGALAYKPIGITHNTDDTKRLYNDPKNHYTEFTKEWELTF